MPNAKVEKALNGLDEQVIDLVGSFVKRRKKHYEQAAQRLHTELKKDAVRFADLLAEEKITKDDLTMLLQGRAGQLKIELLAEISMSRAKFDEIAFALIKLVVKTVFAAI